MKVFEVFKETLRFSNKPWGFYGFKEVSTVEFFKQENGFNYKFNISFNVTIATMQ